MSKARLILYGTGKTQYIFCVRLIPKELSLKVYKLNDLNNRMKGLMDRFHVNDKVLDWSTPEP